jgi:phosphoglycolate phosphatase-like HAD superfamily hydrolase
MIGDSYSDMLAGAAMGMKTILVTETAHPDVRALQLANARARSLLEAVSLYLLK